MQGALEAKASLNSIVEPELSTLLVLLRHWDETPGSLSDLITLFFFFFFFFVPQALRAETCQEEGRMEADPGSLPRGGWDRG